MVKKNFFKYKLRKKIQFAKHTYSIKKIYGYQEVKEFFFKIISNIKKQKENKIFQRNEGTLFFGPPGCGKTTFAKAIAYESKTPFLSISSKDLINNQGIITEEN